MGQNESKTKNSDDIGLKKSSHFGKTFSNPEFWKDSAGIDFIHLSDARISTTTNKSPHKSADLAFLLLGCVEQLTNIPQILESIIDADNPEKQHIEGEVSSERVINTLCAKYKYYDQITSIYQIMNEEIYRFSLMIYHPWKYIPYPVLKKRNLPTIAQILESISNSIDIVEGKSKQFDNILEVSSYFFNVVPATATPPPSKQFFSNVQGNFFSFTTRYALSHGISSNGHFLFVLCAEGNMQIFPLFNMGAISSPINKQLDMVFTNQSSLIAGPETVTIYFQKQIYTYPLTQLLDPEAKVEPEITPMEKEKTFTVVIGDGITHVFIESNFTLHVYNTTNNEKIRTVKLKPGNAKLDPSTPNLLPTMDYCATPMIMTGTIIGLIFRINPSSSLLRVFSLITGEHIHDEQFTSSEQMFSCMNDMYNRSTWTIVKLGDSRFSIKRYSYVGSFDPVLLDLNLTTGEQSKVKADNAFRALALSLSRNIVYLFGSQIIPKVFIGTEKNHIVVMKNLLMRLLNIKKQVAGPKSSSSAIKAAEQFNNSYDLMLQNVVLIFDANLRYLEMTSMRDKNFIDDLYIIITLLPINLATYLFFGHLKFVMHKVDNSSLSYLVGLLDRITSEPLLHWALRNISSTQILKNVPIVSSNPLISLIPDTIHQPKLKPIFESLLLIHQKILTSTVANTLKKDPFLVITMDDNDTNEDNYLNKFGLYTNLLVNKFSNAIATADSLDDLTESLIFSLFQNFVSSLSQLTKYHTVAQQCTALFSVLLTQMKEFFKRASFDPSAASPLGDLILSFLFLYCQFASTLVKGGSLSVFEEKFIWLVKANIRILDQYETNSLLYSTDYNNIPEKYKTFIQKDEDKVMDVIYEKYKKPINRNLKENIKELDRITILAFASHLGIVDELLSLTKEKQISQELRKALDQMIRIRNNFRQLNQESKTEKQLLIKQRLMMLLRMGSDFTGFSHRNILLGNFVLCDTLPDDICKILIRQSQRIQTTIVGFSLIDTAYAMNIHPLFNYIVAYALSRIENFDGLASIMRMTHVNDEQMHHMEQFFNRILGIIQEDKDSDRLVLTAYRFFKDVNLFDNLQTHFLEGVLDAFNKNQKRYSLLAICFSLIHSIKKLPDSLTQFNTIPPIMYLLLSESLKYVECPESVFDSFNSIFWTIKGDISRLTCRAMYYMLQSSQVPDEKVRTTIKTMINFIGECMIQYRSLPLANEMTWIIRRMITQNHRAQKITEELLISINKEKLEEVAGSLTIIGCYIEKIRPYCNTKYHQDRNTIRNCIALQKSENSNITLYNRPFNVMESSFELKPDMSTMIYAVPSIMIDPAKFGHFDFILSLFENIFATAPSIILAIYMQVLAHFCQVPEFVALLTPNHIKTISECPLAFSDISETLKTIDSFAKMPILPEVCGFGQIRYRNNSYISYLSPQIDPSAPQFTINLEYPENQMELFIGIISSNVDKNHTRYSIVSIPDLTTYPVKIPHIHKINPSATKISVVVDITSATFRIENQEFKFPDGTAFKVLIAQKASIPFNAHIPAAATAFIRKTLPPQQQHGCIDFESPLPLYTPPEWITSGDFLKPDVSKIPPTKHLSVGRLTLSDKLMSNFVTPPEYILIHVGFATAASSRLIDEQIRGLFKKLSLQWSTIVLMRITLNRQELITSEKLMMKLFSLLTIQLESFNPSYFEANKFPFSLDKPIWDRNSQSNLLFMSLENENINALRVFVSRPEFKAALSRGLLAMSRSERMHLITRPCSNHHYYIQLSFPQSYALRESIIIAPNDFQGLIDKGFFFIPPDRNPPVQYALPGIIPKIENNRAISVPATSDREISVLDIKPMNNTWIYDTAFEMLLLLKNFVFIATTEEERMAAKKILLDTFIVQSPFIYMYLPQFADLMQVQIPISPFETDESYKKTLVISGSLIRNRHDYVAERFLIFYLHDQHVLTSESSRTLAGYFPEFFSQKIKPSKDTKISIPEAIIDPGAINSNFASHILMLSQFAKHYSSLEGFPFWEILPMWYRVSGAYHGNTDYIDPTLTKTSPQTLHIANPSKLKLEIRLTPITRIGRETMVLMSHNAEFDDPTFIPPAQLGTQSFPINEADMFFSIIGRDTWETIIPTMRVVTKKPKTNQASAEQQVDISSIKQRFVDDMIQFAIKWTNNDTEELINILPRIALREPTFASVENIAKGSSLCSRFSQTVVVLHALLIHHFNYIRFSSYNTVPKSLWDSLTQFVSAEDAAEIISGRMYIGPDNVFPTFSIDRHMAHRIIVDGQGDPDHSIIHQLAIVFNQKDPRVMCCRKRPWKVNFVGESAIDAGGPARELLTEAAASIFEPTSQISIPVPNMRNHQGNNKDVYIPFDQAFNRGIDYWAIGILLGIIIRTGLSQDLPFAPLVWRYLANENITIDDITSVDQGLEDHFNHMREASNDPDFFQKYSFTWTCESWDGHKVSLPGHNDSTFIDKDNVEQYIKEVVDYRINSIKAPLNEIRRGFCLNTGLNHDTMLSGALLSRMAQGNGIITVQHLKQITVIYDFEEGLNNVYVKRFFKAVERLTAEQRKLLLKFITTLTRLPNSTINPDFKIKIDMLQADNPDEKLPTSSTCFNKLHLPKYSNDEICYQKLLIAIQYCQTMENQ